MRGLVVSADWKPRAGYRLTDHERATRRARNGAQAWRDPVLSVTQRPDPAPIERDAVIVRSRAVGICGSDLAMVETDEEGYVRLPYKMRFPVAIGHELAGEVAAVGPDVRRLRVGDPVAVETMLYCGSCRACRRGLFNQCADGEDNGFTLDGGTAQYVTTRERHCWPLDELRSRHDDDTVYEIGALAEPASVAYAGMFVHAGGFAPGSPVVVFGCGPVGLAAVTLARAAGAAPVIAFDPQAERRALAGLLGADIALAPAEAATVRELTAGHGAAMVIEASGHSSTLFPDIEAMLDDAGVVVMLGMDIAATGVRMFRLQHRAARIVGSNGHLCGGFGAALRLHATGRIDLSPIITARYDLADGLAAMDAARTRHGGKTLIVHS